MLPTIHNGKTLIANLTTGAKGSNWPFQLTLGHWKLMDIDERTNGTCHMKDGFHMSICPYVLSFHQFDVYF